MAKPELNCWKCKAALVDVLVPFLRLSKCKACNVDLHVCRMCRYYDTRVSNSCREPIAEKVIDKKRANFCGYFQPRENVKENGDETEKSSKASLQALFGLEQGGPGLSAGNADAALQELDALFGLKEKKRD